MLHGLMERPRVEENEAETSFVEDTAVKNVASSLKRRRRARKARGEEGLPRAVQEQERKAPRSRSSRLARVRHKMRLSGFVVIPLALFLPLAASQAAQQPPVANANANANTPAKADAPAVKPPAANNAVADVPAANVPAAKDPVAKDPAPKEPAAKVPAAKDPVVNNAAKEVPPAAPVPAAAPVPPPVPGNIACVSPFPRNHVSYFHIPRPKLCSFLFLYALHPSPQHRIPTESSPGLPTDFPPTSHRIPTQSPTSIPEGTPATDHLPAPSFLQI